MKPLYQFLLCLLFSIPCFSQGQANNWYFGNGAGIRFASDGTVTSVTGGQLYTNEGCSSISDAGGNLLFYSDGRTVWDRNHRIMPNGNYTAGTGLLGDPSSTQSAIIVPQPGNPNIYYIFTVDEPHQDNAATYPSQNTSASMSEDDGFNNGLNYSVVDLSVIGANGSIGNITTRNTHLVTYNPGILPDLRYKCSEKISAVKDNTGSGYWVLTHFVDKFYAFKIDASGVNLTPVISALLPSVPTSGYRRNSIGYMKSSPDGSKIVLAHNQLGTITGGTEQNGQVVLYDFDNSTGVVSNPVTLLTNGNPYGVEFSADSEKVYATNGVSNTSSQLWQYDITVTPPSAVLINQASVSTGALQLGPDKKIYRAYLTTGSGSSYLGVINNPEVNGIACNYMQQGIRLAAGTASTLGLPPFITSVFDTTISVLHTCLGDNTEFSIAEDDIDSISWDFGDGSVSNQLAPTHIYAAVGVYTVTVTLTIDGEVITNSEYVTIHEMPTASPITTPVINQCDDNQDQIYDFNFSSLTSQILGLQDPAFFDVKYFTSHENAVDDVDPISNGEFTNTTPTFSIFAKVINKANTKCYDITSFTVKVSKKPVINTLNDLKVCDNATDGDNANGKATFDLSLLNNAILGTQSASGYTISYHLDQSDADLDLNQQPLSFSNTIADSQPLYVRIENNENPQCYTTQRFNVIVNPLPVGVPSVLTQCDYEFDPDGFTTFNLDEANNALTGGNTADYRTEFFTTGSATPLNSVFTNTQNPQILTVRVIDRVTQCYGITTLQLNVTTNPTVNFDLHKCDDSDEDGITLFDLTQIPYTSGGNTVTYYLSSNDALLEQNSLPVNYTNTIPFEQRIFARVENGNDCVGIYTADLFVDALPQIDITGDAIFCLNSPTTPVILDAGLEGQNPLLFTYLWTPNGETSPTIEAYNSGTYTVTVKNAAGCPKVRTITVTDSDIAVVESVSVVDLSDNNSITVYVVGDESQFLYSLDLPNGPFQESNYFDDVTPGVHNIYITDKEDCGTIRKEVPVLAIPKFFTPNGDSYNDTWKIAGMENGHYRNTTIHIFDRFGKLVKQMAPTGEGWNGVYNNQLLPATDYWYVIFLDDGRTIKGHFSLKR